MQISRDRLVSNGYVRPIGRLGGYLVAYDILGKANAASQFKGERSFASDREKANGGGKKGGPPFVHDLLTSLDILPPAMGELDTPLRQCLGEDFRLLGGARLIERTPDTIVLSVPTEDMRGTIIRHCKARILEVAGVAELKFRVELPPPKLRRMP